MLKRSQLSGDRAFVPKGLISYSRSMTAKKSAPKCLPAWQSGQVFVPRTCNRLMPNQRFQATPSLRAGAPEPRR